MVYHVGKDGTITKDITGRVVKLSEAETLYQLMYKMSNKKSKDVHKKVS